MWFWSVQFTMDCRDDVEAVECRDWLLQQIDCLGARSLPAGGGKPPRVQSLHSAEGVKPTDVLPDGCRLCMTSGSLLKNFKAGVAHA